MIPEIGHFALILALSLALCQGIIPLVGAHRNDEAMMAIGRTAANGQFLFVAIAFGCLTWAFVQSDFSVLYVANHSQLSLPTIYKISAVWGAHEGSLLMWVLILSIWTVAVGRYSANLPTAFTARVLGVLGLLSTGFLLFTLLTSNPFERLIPAPMDGGDLNPLLQDPGLAIHPPLLYIGYVGFSVAFAFAIAAMISGDLDRTWARWTRPWTTVAWLFLTLGIALGSWWAYYELGWGLGWLVVLGSGRERLFHALARWYRTDPFAGGHGAPRPVQELDAASRDRGILAEPVGHFPRTLRHSRVGACICNRSGTWLLHSGFPRYRNTERAGAIRLARAEP
jgi:cytochrome c-type biogenesis protein CcmF